MIEQMEQSSWYTISRPTVTVTVTEGSSNVGDGTLIASALDGNGDTIQFAFAETIVAKVTSDSQRGATENREPVSVVGEPAVSDVLDPDWPAGSGISTSITVTDASQDGLASNTDFDTWASAASPPDDWTITTGTITTTVVRSGNYLTGNFALSFVGNASELTTLDQALTVSDFDPATVYAVCYWVKVSSVPAAGVIALQLVDGSNNVTTDAAGNSNSVTKSLPAASDSEYVPVTGFFRTGFVLPTALKLRIKLTTALSNTVSVYVDRVSVVEATQLYVGGPFCAAFSGGTPLRLNDSWTIAVANNHGVDKMSRALDRLLDLRTGGYRIPDSASNTISDSLIT
jgi:hypothetical protein